MLHRLLRRLRLAEALRGLLAKALLGWLLNRLLGRLLSRLLSRLLGRVFRRFAGCRTNTQGCVFFHLRLGAALFARGRFARHATRRQYGRDTPLRRCRCLGLGLLLSRRLTKALLGGLLVRLLVRLSKRLT